MRKASSTGMIGQWRHHALTADPAIWDRSHVPVGGSIGKVTGRPMLSGERFAALLRQSIGRYSR
jgi:hypothetical protein